MGLGKALQRDCLQAGLLLKSPDLETLELQTWPRAAREEGVVALPVALPLLPSGSPPCCCDGIPRPEQEAKNVLKTEKFSGSSSDAGTPLGRL